MVTQRAESDLPDKSEKANESTAEAPEQLQPFDAGDLLKEGASVRQNATAEQDPLFGAFLEAHQKTLDTVGNDLARLDNNVGALAPRQANRNAEISTTKELFTLANEPQTREQFNERMKANRQNIIELASKNGTAPLAVLKNSDGSMSVLKGMLMSDSQVKYVEANGRNIFQAPTDRAALNLSLLIDAKVKQAREVQPLV